MNTLYSLTCYVYISTIVLIFLCLSAASLQAGEIHNAAAAGDLNKVQSIITADPGRDGRNHPGIRRHATASGFE